MKYEDLPFQRGQTRRAYDDDTGTTNVATAETHLEGKEYTIEDIDFSASSNNYQSTRSGKYVTLRCVRNKTGSALLPKRAAKFKTDGSTADVYGGQMDGYAEAVGVIGGVVDEFLPDAGVPDGELFWLVVAGPTKITSAAAGDTTWGIGALLVPSTDGKLVEADPVTTQVPGNSEANIETAITAAEGLALGFTARACEAVSAINTDAMAIVRRSIW